MSKWRTVDTPEHHETEWRPVPGWEGHYEVSNTGGVRKLDGTILGQWLKGGYPTVRLSKPRKLLFVHRAVAGAFIPNPRNLPFVNHIDNDKTHNYCLNLEWCTQKGNLDHARSQGRMPDNYWVGKRTAVAKLTDESVMEIRRLYAAGSYSHQDLASKFSVSKRSIGRVINKASYANV